MSSDKLVFDLGRRRFIKAAGVGGVFVVGLPLIVAQHSFAQAATDDTDHAQPNVFVGINADGTVEITCHRSDMGQHIRTAIAQIIADELEADWSRVRVLQAPGDRKYGDQNTDGSRSIRFNFRRLRIAGASVRHMLRVAGAGQLSVPAAECTVQNHQVIHERSGRRREFADVVGDLHKVDVPAADKVQLKTRDQWRYINTSQSSVDIDALVTGAATFGADVRLPNTSVAVIARPPVVSGKVRRYNASAAKALPGVLEVVELPAPTAPLMFQSLGGVAVIASNTYAAMKGRDALEIEWDDGANQNYDSQTYRRELEAKANQPGNVIRSEGDADTVLNNASRVVSAEYYVPHLAHAPMEPPVATARVKEDGIEIWSATQNPQADQSTVASMLNLRPAQVKVNVTLLGGAFGRKSKPDFSAEAAYLASKTGRTIRLQWTREDEIQHGFYHTVTAQKLDGALDKSGSITAFRHRSVFPSLGALWSPTMRSPMPTETGQGLIDSPIDTANLQIETGEASAHVRVGWMRSVSNISHAFAVQSFISEMAHAAGKDPRDFLLAAIAPARHLDLAKLGRRYPNYDAPLDQYPYDTGRLTNVINQVADMAAWDRKRGHGSGLGIAAHRSFLSYVATVVEVEVSDAGDLHIPRVWMSIDAGTVVNPDTVINQCQGGAVFGLSCALHGQITAGRGAIEQSNFHDYRVARINEAPPEINVSIVESDEMPAGVGEPPTPPFAPALCNAIFAATGKRIRELPIGNQLKS